MNISPYLKRIAGCIDKLQHTNTLLWNLIVMIRNLDLGPYADPHPVRACRCFGWNRILMSKNRIPDQVWTSHLQIPSNIKHLSEYLVIKYILIIKIFVILTFIAKEKKIRGNFIRSNIRQMPDTAFSIRSDIEWHTHDRIVDIRWVVHIQ